MLCLVPVLLHAQQPSVPADSVSHQVEGRRNSAEQAKKPYVILISADGFRYDYPEKYQAPHLLELSRSGVRAAAMIPSFPSVTFPNHYTLVTGLYPAHHGLVNNSFYNQARDDKYEMGDKNKVSDQRWYGGTPLWVLAEKQHLLSASMFWVGSEAEIQGTRPSYYYTYTEKLPVAERIKAVVGWLNLPEERRPHLITFYLSEPDHSGHHFGPDAPETAAAVKMVDETIFALTRAVQATGLPVNFIFVSDHGMTGVDTAHPIPTPASIDTAKFDLTRSSTMLELYARHKKDIRPMYSLLRDSARGYQVYLKNKVPARLHYGKKDDRYNHIGDILLVPEWPLVFSDKKPGLGHHGFDPLKVKEMQAMFMAWGPLFVPGKQIPAFSNVNIYPLITAMLGLKETGKIDGHAEVLNSILIRR